MGDEDPIHNYVAFGRSVLADPGLAAFISDDGRARIATLEAAGS